MPEGPEVYIATKELRNKFLNNVLNTITIIDQKRYSRKFTMVQEKLPSKVIDIYSKGKKTIMRLDNGFTLMISYGMTGRWSFTESKFTELEFNCGNTTAYWTCSRKLPTCIIQVFKDNIIHGELEKLGHDILGPEINDNTILTTFGKSRKGIAGFLMEQNKFCGIGNYIKAVVLYRTKISPHRKVNELTESQKLELWKCARNVAQESVNAGGGGSYNSNSNSFDITPYQMKVDSFGNKVYSENISGRMTWWVPNVQS